MGQVLIKYAIIFVVLVLIQVLFLNQVQFSGFVNPYIYILFIMLLPLKAPRYAILIGAFLLGLSVDIFSNTLGIHAFASVFIAYVRPVIIRVITNREEDVAMMVVAEGLVVRLERDHPIIKDLRMLVIIMLV